MRTSLPIHPVIHENKDEDKDGKEDPLLDEAGFQLQTSLELEINEYLIIIFTKKDEKQEENIIDRPPNPNGFFRKQMPHVSPFLNRLDKLHKTNRDEGNDQFIPG
jgi:hypothetical protein